MSARDPEPENGEPDARIEQLIGEARRRERVGTIELLVATIVLLALIAFAIWFFAFAHNPPP